MSDYRSPVYGQVSNSWYYVDCALENCDIVKYNIDNEVKETIFTSHSDIKSMSISHTEETLALTIKEGSMERVAILDLDGDKLELTYINQSGFNTLPVFSPEKHSIYYVNWHASRATSIMRYDVIAHKSNEISTQLDRITTLATLADNTLIAAAKVNGEYALWQIDLESNFVTRYANIEAGTSILNLHLSEHGDKLLYSKNSSDLNIKFAGFATTFSKLNSDAHDMKGVWANTTNSIYFVSNRTGSYELWQHHNNSNEKLTALAADSIAQPILSPAQDKLAFIIRRNNLSQLHLYDSEMAEVSALAKISNGSFLLGWSHEEDALYLSVRSENMYDLAKYTIATGELKTIKLGAGLIAQEDPLTNSFYYGDLANKQLKRIADNGEESVFYDFKATPLRVAPNSVKVANDEVYYLGNTDQALILFKNRDAVLSLPKTAFVSHIITEPTPKVIYDTKVPSPSILEMQVAIELSEE
ncbi:TolB-like translocation protein [Pseudoalteromonas sp. GB56]